MPGAQLSLRGIYAPVPTAFGDDETLHLDELAQNVRRWNEEPLAGYVVGGSNGEFPLLTREERLEVMRVVAGERSPGRTVIGGASMESTGAAAEMAVAVAEAGADAVIVVTPWYYKGRMTAAALVAHYARVADASPVPVLVYNMPAHTGVDIPIAAVAELSEHPNIAGIKESLPDAVKIGRMIRQCRSGFQVLAGSAGSFLPALAVGAVGGILALANIAARPLDRLMVAFTSGDLAAARTAQLDLIELNALVTERYSIAGLKAAMDMLGYYGGPVRQPLLGVSSAEREEIRGALAQVGLTS